jgi:hypothetical protein
MTIRVLVVEDEEVAARAHAAYVERMDGRLGLHLGEVLGAAERLGVDLVDVLGARRPGREPRVLGGHLEPADRAPLPGASVSLAVIGSPASSVAVTSSGESLPSLAFCSRRGGASMRAYAGSPCARSARR